MKSVRYEIEIHSADETEEALATFAASAPLSNLYPGALLAVEATSEDGSPARLLRVVEVLHAIGESDCIVHRIRVFVRPDDEAQEKERRFDVAGITGRARDKVADLAGSVKLPRLRPNTARILDDYGPIIRELLITRLGSSAREALKDDEVLDGALRNIYQLLPVPVRLALKEDAFVGLCLRHRDRFLREPEAAPATPALPPQADAGGASAA